MSKHADYPHELGMLYDCPPCEEYMRLTAELTRVQECCGDPAAVVLLQAALRALETGQP